ncbi:MAG: nuclear transport factor 2 family protein [Bacteroidia bacterium]|nr:nuclear transport factor 2 family protein [Bacteroidia bacterium]
MQFNLTLTLLLCACLATSAQSPDEAAVAGAVEALKTAMVDADKAALEEITTQELSYGHSSGRIEDRTAFINALVSGSSDFVTIELAEQTIRVVGNTAIVRHKLSGTTSDNGKAGTVNLGVMLIWQKQQGKWKLLARQAYKL